ncbi:MAG TPA: NAD(P)H-dependent oxidoreductase [Prolixibacteraceae bacterium]|nr:NAD(P)H-dependent oxidoreductase [Prolixibacteraceae bacterium]
MKLAVFNGSPRRTNSNSTLLITQFLNGYYGNNTYYSDIHYLAETTKNEEHTKAFEIADNVIVIFPLYTDAMPGQVKLFFENIAQIKAVGKRVGFIVQSGFPEAYHSVFVQRYLEKLAKTCQWNYLGTVIRGGVEGIQMFPKPIQKRLFHHFYCLGKVFCESGKLDKKIIVKLAQPYRFGFLRRNFFKMMIKTGLANFYWKMKLKENNAWDKRFAAPYA